MCCCSSTTFSASPRLVPRSLPYLVISLLLFVINQHFPLIWVACQCNFTLVLYIADCCLRQEHITTTKKGSITSVQAVYVPADDLTDPAPATTFAHLVATTVLSRSITELGIYPAVNPLDSKSHMLDPCTVGWEHYEVATAIQKILQDYKSLQDIIAILAMDELTVCMYSIH